VVALSAAEVYAIAELIRRRNGGCAVGRSRWRSINRNIDSPLPRA
jgi:hypothetical protein